MTTLQNYIPNNFLKLDDPSALGKQVTQELQKISNSIGVANQGITANTASITADEAAWTSYTPVVSAGSGTFTSVAAFGAYKTVGKTVHMQIDIRVTTNGTASSSVLASLPFTASSKNFILCGREFTAGLQLSGFIGFGDTNVHISRYDNAYPSFNGAILLVSGTYERV
jgi:hypothetical protein